MIGGSNVAHAAPWCIVSVDPDDMLSSRCRNLLAAAGRPCELERLDSASALAGALRRKEPDIVWLVTTPHGLEPARIIDLIRAQDADVPLIVLAWRSDPRRAAEALRRGAADFIPQRELERLVPVIERELRAAEARRQHRRMQLEATHGDGNFRTLADASPHGMLVHSDHRPLYVNGAFARLCGYAGPQDILGLGSVAALLSTAEAQPQPRRDELPASRQSASPWYACALRRREGDTVQVELGTVPLAWDGAPTTLVVAVDVTDGGRPAPGQAGDDAMLQAVLDAMPHPVWVKDAAGDRMRYNRHFEDFAGLPGAALADAQGTAGAALQGTIRDVLLQDARVAQEQGAAGVDTTGSLIGEEHGGKAMRIVQRPLHGDAGQLLGLVGIAVDISDRRQTEVDLLEANVRLSDAIDSSPAAFYYIDAQQRVQIWNRKVLELFPMFEPILRKGIPAEEFLRQAATSYLGPDIDVEAYVKWRMARLQDPPADSFEYVTAHGRTVIVQDRKSASGGTVIVTVDVTDIRRQERALAMSEANFRNVLRHTADGVCIEDPQGRLVQVNPRLCAMTGYDEAELLQMNYADLIEPESLAADPPHPPQLRAGQPMLAVRPACRKDGSRIVIEANAILQPDGNILSIVRDVTDRERADHALRDSQRLLQAVFDTIPYNLYVKDLQRRYLAANRAFADSHNLALEDIIGRHMEDLVARPQSEVELIAEQDRAVLTGSMERVDQIHVGRLTAPRPRTLHTIKTPLRNDAGQIFGLVGISVDVTEIEAAQAALRDERELLKSVFDTIPHEVYVKDPHGHYLAVNRSVMEAYGSTAGSVIGHTFGDVVARPQEELDEVAEMDRAVLSASVPFVNRTHTVHMPDGRGHTVHTIKTPLRDKAGQIIGLVGITEDVTELAATHAALKEHQQLLQSVFQTIPHMIYVKDQAGRFVVANRHCAQAFGITPEQLAGLNVVEVAPSGFPEWQQVLDTDLRILRGEQDHADEVLRLHLNDGVAHAIRAVKEPLRDEHGNIYGMVGISEDVTDLDRAQAALRENRRLLASIFETMPQAVFVKDKQQRYIAVNRRAAEVFGLGADTFIGKTLSDTQVELTPAWRRAIEMDRRILDGTSTHESDVLQFSDPDGSPRWVSLIKEPLRDEEGRVNGIVGIGEDITELYSAKAQATAAHAMLYDAIQNLWAAFYLYDKDERLQLWNDRVFDLFPLMRGKLRKGMTFEEVLRLGVGAVDFSEQSVEAYMQRRLAEFRNPGGQGHERLLKDGRWLLVRDRRTSDGGTVSLRHEITDLKQTEQALRKSEQRFRLLTENAPDLIFSYRLRPDRGFEYVSPVAGNICGYSPAEHYDDPELWTRIAHPDDHEKQEAVFRSEQMSAGKLVSVRWRHRNGNWVWLEERCTPVYDDAGLVVRIEGIVRDVSSRKLLEDQLLQAQRMEAVGQLAGGIAHDFNNMLMVMSSYSGFVLDELPPDHKAVQDVRMIQSAVERSAALTRQLLAFSRKQILRIQNVQLNELITQMGKILRRVIGEDILLETRLTLDLDTLLGDPGQIEQIIMNLAVNSRDAMPRGGTLTLETHNLAVGPDGATFAPELSPGRYVTLTFADTGVGMSKDILSHIFEPFFTTKQVGKGTGLGLSMVYGIVRQMGGDVWVASEPGVGTTFKIFLPCGSQVDEQPEATPAGDSDLDGSESILLVEDEDSVRNVAQRILEKHGYTVIPASNAEAAELIFRKMGESIDLVLTDVVMPVISGPEMVKHLATRRSDLRVLYMTGYAESAIIHHIGADEAPAILQKPFTQDMLLRSVRQALEASGT